MRTSIPLPQRVLDFVEPAGLDDEAAREHAANAVALDSPRKVQRRIEKGLRNPLLEAQTKRNVDVLVRLLAPYDASWALVSLGSGSGFELRALLSARAFDPVYSSDLAWSATSLVPQAVEPFEGRLGLFAADFAALPGSTSLAASRSSTWPCPTRRTPTARWPR